MTAIMTAIGNMLLSFVLAAGVGSLIGMVLVGLILKAVLRRRP